VPEQGGMSAAQDYGQAQPPQTELARDAYGLAEHQHMHDGSAMGDPGYSDANYAREEAIRHEERMRAEMEARQNQQLDGQPRTAGFVPVPTPFQQSQRPGAPQSQNLFKKSDEAGKGLSKADMKSKLTDESQTDSGEAVEETTRVDNIQPQPMRVEPRRKDSKNRLRSALGQADSPGPAPDQDLSEEISEDEEKDKE
ncbi:MAG TPA: hypothetical protein PKD05_21520, partial [Candidatus Melainabacteria bacterium]|nr:hypothetical protein [Candidatus Melainabacteria bacterium]